MTPHSNQADIGTGISVLSAIVSISGIMAIRYYYNVTKKVKNEIPK